MRFNEATIPQQKDFSLESIKRAKKLSSLGQASLISKASGIASLNSEGKSCPKSTKSLDSWTIPSRILPQDCCFPRHYLYVPKHWLFESVPNSVTCGLGLGNRWHSSDSLKLPFLTLSRTERKLNCLQGYNQWVISQEARGRNTQLGLGATSKNFKLLARFGLDLDGMY